MGAVDAEAMAGLGEIASGNGMPDEAANFFREAICLDPHRLSCYTSLARILATRRQYRQAESVIRQAQAYFPHSEMLKLTRQGLHLAAAAS